MSGKKDTSKSFDKLKSEQQRQSKELGRVKRYNRWLMWAGGVLAIVLLLCMLIMGYATNWWQKPVRTSQKLSDSGQSSGNTDQTSPAGGSGGSTTERASETSNSSHGSTTTTNNTTTNTTTNNNTATDSSTVLKKFLDELSLGQNIDEVKAEATRLGIDVDCKTELGLVEVCELSKDGQTITIKALTTNDQISGITANL